jgi:hypothetical protein
MHQCYHFHDRAAYFAANGDEGETTMSLDAENGTCDLTGQVAIVMGGGRGLGRAFA